MFEWHKSRCLCSYHYWPLASQRHDPKMQGSCRPMELCAPSTPSFPQSQKISLVHASGHCYGPACISMELYNADTGELICAVHPILGTGDEPMNEAGYVVGIPPCSWGSEEEGMAPAPLLDLNTNLMSVKKANSTIYLYH